MGRKIWPIILLFLIEIVLVVANYVPGTWLMGWDNVMPEFNFRQAFITNIFGVWQEHRGLGLYDGMGHAANFVHTIFLWLLSLALPTHLLRYTFHFLMHLLGGVGAYVLLSHVIPGLTRDPTHQKSDSGSPYRGTGQAPAGMTKNLIPLAGALFYLLNLATIQMFYTPLEAFSVHFVALPWLAWGLLGYLTQPSRKTFFLFLTISLLSTPQFFIPTLLLPVGILLGSITLFTFTQESVLRTQDTLLKKPVTAFVGFLFINAFWLLPYVYGLPHNAPVIQAAKINQMSSSEVFARNQAFGGLGDVIRLRGFPLDFEDIATSGTTTFLMAPWREFLASPIVTAGSWIIVLILGIGVIGVIRERKGKMDRGAGGFLLTFFVALLFLANDTPILKDVFGGLRTTLPFFAEGFRFPFTKFVLLFALSSTILFTMGVAWITETFARFQKKFAVTAPLLGGILIVALALPAFRGNFISDRLRVPLPDDYPRVFAFMRDKPLGRIAYLPQQQYWSWKYYRWGYRGSGFAWYGLPQPILDRAFDPWSGYNENYYWEISRSIYSKDAQALEAVLDKYDVRYVLLDENLISPSHNRALYVDETKEMLESLWNIKEVARFEKLTVYEREIPAQGRNDNSNIQSFVSLKTDLPAVSPAYGWTDNDVAFEEVGDYEIASPRLAGSRNDVWIYPFRSLFTKRSVDEREFTVEESDDSITILPSLFGETSGISLKRDIHKQKDNNEQRIRYAYFYIDVRPVDHNVSFSSQMASTNETIPPSILIVKGSTFTDQSVYSTLGKISNAPNHPADRLVNNPENTRKPEGENAPSIPLTVSNESLAVNVILKAAALLYDSTKSADLVAANVKPCGVLRNSPNPLFSKEGAMGELPYLRFTSRAQRGCLSFGIPNLPHRDGYLVAVESRWTSGRPLLFSLINQTAKHVELETYLPSNSPLPPLKVRGGEGELTLWTTSYFILPPLAPDGLGYTVYLSNDAIGRQESINDIKSIKFYRIPYQKLVTMSLRANAKQSLEIATSPVAPRDDMLKVDHPNPAYYKIVLRSNEVTNNETTLILSQSFDNGWIAMAKTSTFPFFALLKNHVLVNNWKNGWVLPSNQVTNNERTIIIFFWPQIFQWLGFALLPLPFLWVWYTKHA